jgi:DNA-binding CsgD family transcriptional regulator
VDVFAEKLPDTLLRLYDLPNDQDVFDHFLSVLEEQILCDLSGYSFTNLNTGRLERKSYRGKYADRMTAIHGLDESNQSHPFREIYITDRHGPVLDTSGLISKQEWFNSELYNKVYVPCGLQHDTSLRFYTHTTCISFFFSGEKPMDEVDRLFLLKLSPHLKRAYKLINNYSHEIRDPLISMIWVSSSGTVESSSPVAWRLLDSFFPAKSKVAEWDLPDAVKIWIELNLDGPQNARHSKKILNKLRVINREGALYLTFIYTSRGYSVLLETVPWDSATNSIQTLGLTPREAEILLWAMQGKQYAAIADILDVKLSTVRKHMEHILEKLECENRMAASAKARQSISEHQANVLQIECLSCVRADCAECTIL